METHPWASVSCSIALSVSSFSTIQIPDREPGLLPKVRAHSAS